MLRVNDPTPRTRGLRRATWSTVATGLALLALLGFTASLVIQEYQARAAAAQEAIINDALSLANRMIRFSLELDSHVLMRTENPSTTEMAGLLAEFSELSRDLRPIVATRPDMDDRTAGSLDRRVRALSNLVTERNDLLAIRNNLDVAVRENATAYQGDETASALIDLLSQAIAADNLILLGELTRRLNLDLRNSQIHATLASRYRQLAFSNRGVFPVTEDLVIANGRISRQVLQTQIELDQIINRIQTQPGLHELSTTSTLRFLNWQAISLMALTLGLALLIMYTARQWRKYLQSAHQQNRLESLGQISGDVAHDINNMICVTISSLNILKETAGATGRHHDHNLDKALFAADKSVGMIDRLLTFARRNRLSPELCCVNELISGLYEVVCLTVGEDVEVHLDLCEGDTYLLIDPGQLESALINLCINARNAIAENGSIHVATAIHRKRFLHITVSDDGCGIPRQVLPRVFEPFFTTDKTRNGLGLGLSTIYGFVKQSGGDVLISSTVGKGTQVTMIFKQ